MTKGAFYGMQKESNEKDVKMSTIEKLITQISEKDDEAQSSFNSIIMEKLSVKLEGKKQEVMFGTFGSKDPVTKDI